jgi:hypothetical protein
VLTGHCSGAKNARCRQEQKNKTKKKTERIGFFGPSK